MSPVGQYIRGMENRTKLLKLLALNKQLYQGKMAKMCGVVDRTILRQLEPLKKLGLVRIAKKEQSAKRGKDKYVLELTFTGLLMVISDMFLPEEELDQIAENHKDKWVIFQAWDKLAKDPEVKRTIMNGIQLYASQHSLTELHKSIADHLGKARWWKDWLGAREQNIIREATLSALMLDKVFSMGAAPPWVYEPENRDHVLVKLWKTCIENPNVRKFIEEQFKHEDYRHRIIGDFREWLLEGRLPKEATPVFKP